MTHRLALFVLLPVLAFTTACSDRANSAPSGTTASSAEVSSTPTSPVAATTATTRANADGPATHEGERALAHVQQLATVIGPRVAGTQGEQQAAAYIAGQFRAFGYAVETPTFEFTGDRFRAATLKVGDKQIEAIAMDGGAGGTVAGLSVFIGLGDVAGINGRNLSGKIAVADRGILTFAEKSEAAHAAGAIGLVVLNNAEGQLNGRIAPATVFPVLGVAGGDAPAVRLAANAGERFELIASSGGPSKGTNVVARSATGAACDIVVGGHYDSVPAAPGANDNASGTANVIELARAMAADGIDKGMCFAAFSAEESGLFGSDAFVKQLRAEGHLPRAMVNMDVTGIGTGLEVIGDDALVTEAIGIAGGLKIDARRSSLPANAGSDHQSFQKAGVPSIWFFSGDFPTIHSPRDVTADIDARELDRAGDVAQALIAQLLRQFARG